MLKSDLPICFDFLKNCKLGFRLSSALWAGLRVPGRMLQGAVWSALESWNWTRAFSDLLESSEPTSDSFL